MQRVMFVCKYQILDVKTWFWVRDANRFRSGRGEEIGLYVPVEVLILGRANRHIGTGNQGTGSTVRYKCE
jgi:hypothetical protein